MRRTRGPTGKDFVPFGVGLVQLDDVIRVEGRLTENDPAKLAVRHGRRADHGAVHHRRRGQRDRHVRLPAGLREDSDDDERRRHHRRGAAPVRPVRARPPWRWAPTPSQLALADAGVEWKDIQFGFGGSYEVANPDAVDRLVGLTGIPFTNVFNACATAASRHAQTRRHASGWASTTSASPSAWTSTRAARSPTTRPSWRMPQWYAENGQFVTTKFFGMKANRYMHDHGISQETLAKVAAKNFRNGALNPNAFRRKPISEEEILNSPMLNYPLTQYMFCAPDEGAAAVSCAAPTSRTATPTSRCIVQASRGPHPRATAPTRCTPRSRRSTRTSAPTVYAAKAAFEKAGIGTGGRRRHPAAGHRRRRRGHPHGRERVLRRRRAGEAARRRRHRDRRPACRSTPTAG